MRIDTVRPHHVPERPRATASPSEAASPPAGSTPTTGTAPATGTAPPDAPVPGAPAADGAPSPVDAGGRGSRSQGAEHRSDVATLRQWVNHPDRRDAIALPDLAADHHGQGFAKAVAAYQAVVAATAPPAADPVVAPPVDGVPVVAPPVDGDPVVALPDPVVAPVDEPALTDLLLETPPAL